jgi:hypothetical protein
MQDHKLVKQIEKMTLPERERFRRLVSSPYFNQHEPTIQLLDYILEALPDHPERIERHQLFEHLFPGEKFRMQALYDLTSNLGKLYERFLANEFLDEHPLRAELLTLEAAYAGNRFDYFKGRARKLHRLVDASDVHDEQEEWITYQLLRIEAYYLGKYEDRADPLPFQKMLRQLDHFYIVEKLHHACHLTANMLLMNTSYDFGFLDAILAYVEAERDGALAGQLSVELYYCILMSMRELDNPGHYYRLLELMDEHFDAFTPREQKDLFNFSCNYCIARTNRNDLTFLRELYNLYQRGLENGAIFDHGLLSEWNFKNIVSVGCTLEEFAETEQFIETYRERLPEDKREVAYALGMAQFHYRRKEYDQAGRYLRNVRHTDVKYHLGRVLLEVRIAYEQHDTNYLINILDTFRLYVLRQRKITTAEKKSYTNYVRFTKQLVLLKHQAEYIDDDKLRAKLDKLHRKIRDTEQLFGKDWLVQESAPVEV